MLYGPLCSKVLSHGEECSEVVAAPLLELESSEELDDELLEVPPEFALDPDVVELLGAPVAPLPRPRTGAPLPRPRPRARRPRPCAPFPRPRSRASASCSSAHRCQENGGNRLKGTASLSSSTSVTILSGGTSVTARRACKNSLVGHSSSSGSKPMCARCRGN